MIWDEFSSQMQMAGKSPKAHTEMSTSSRKRLFVEMFGTHCGRGTFARHGRMVGVFRWNGLWDDGRRCVSRFLVSPVRCYGLSRYNATFWKYCAMKKQSEKFIFAMWLGVFVNKLTCRTYEASFFVFENSGKELPGCRGSRDVFACICTIRYAGWHELCGFTEGNGRVPARVFFGQHGDPIYFPRHALHHQG